MMSNRNQKNNDYLCSMFLGFGIDAWITIATLVAVMTLLLFTRLRADIVFLGAVGVLYVTGVLDVTEAFSGFISTPSLVIGVMCVVVAGLSYTGVLQWITNHVLGQPKGEGRIFMRLTIPVALLSSFIVNDTVVMFFVGVVQMWAKKLGVTPSRLLIPLSYAAGMGGALTIFVTTSGLVISGLYAEQTGSPLGIFASFVPAAACLVVGLLVVFACRRLLPDRSSASSGLENIEEFTVEMMVTANNPHIGKTIGELGLNNVQAGTFIELIHFDNCRALSPVSEDEILMGGDHLIFAGDIETLVALAEKMGFVSSDFPVLGVSPEEEVRNFCTAYVSFGSSLIGTRLGKSSFEKDHDMTLVAVSRRGVRIDQPPRDVILRGGDSLLFIYPIDKKIDKESMKKDLQFFDIEQITSKSKSPLVSSAILVAMVLLISTGVMPLLQGAFLAAGAMLLFRCCSPSQAMDSIDLSLIITVAGGISLGMALEKTGLAEQLAMNILAICGDNPLIVMIAICLVTAVVTEFISNTAVAALMFPIMCNAVTALHCYLLPFAIALILSVNSAFMTPIGTTLSLMVYGPGGYSANDFLRMGLPVKLFYLATAILIISLMYHL